MEMTKKRDSGTIIVRSNPSGAIVTIEGESKYTPALFDVESRELPYNITIIKDGYEDCIHKAIVSKGSVITVETILTKKVLKKDNREILNL